MMSQPWRVRLRSLAHRLGFRSLRAMLEELNSREISEWLVYFKLEAEEMERSRREANAELEALAELRRSKQET